MTLNDILHIIYEYDEFSITLQMIKIGNYGVMVLSKQGNIFLQFYGFKFQVITFLEQKVIKKNNSHQYHENKNIQTKIVYCKIYSFNTINLSQYILLYNLESDLVWRLIFI